ncbi:hypothetical protein H4582DRAFT_1893733 [Lactarius indigo]|nr:hypothetical protein H4582DRAFT_1893733 [Lactarius indigo]
MMQSVSPPGEVRGLFVYPEPEPSLFSPCDVADHHLDSKPHIHDAPASTARPFFDLPDNSSPAHAPRPDVSSLPIPVSRHVDESFTRVSPHGNDIYVPGPSHPAYRIAPENARIPSTSQDQVTACVIQGGVDTSVGMIHLSAPEPSASTLPAASKATTSPGTVTIPHTAHRRTPSDDPDIPPSPVPTLVLGDIPPTEPHLSIEAPAALFVSSLWSTSAPDLGTVTQDEGNPKTALHKENGALERPLVTQENIVASRHLPPQLSSQSSFTDVAIADLSRHSLDDEHTGNHPSHPLNEYDIV